MQLRQHEAVTSKRDYFMIDPRKIVTIPGYNVRDLTTPEAIESLHVLKGQIINDGVKTPLEVRLLDDGTVAVIKGHRRLAAAMLAIGEGHEITAIPCLPEPKGTSDIDRAVDLILSNSGEPLKPMETAQVVKRLANFGMNNKAIAARLCWKTVATVDMYLELLSAPTEVQDMVRSGEVSATTAAGVSKSNGTNAGTVLRAAKAEAASNGCKRVTARHVHKATGEFNPSRSNVNIMSAALLHIAGHGDEDSANRATKALESVGLIKPKAQA